MAAFFSFAGGAGVLGAALGLAAWSGKPAVVASPEVSAAPKAPRIVVLAAHFAPVSPAMAAQPPLRGPATAPRPGRPQAGSAGPVALPERPALPLQRAPALGFVPGRLAPAASPRWMIALPTLAPLRPASLAPALGPAAAPLTAPRGVAGPALAWQAALPLPRVPEPAGAAAGLPGPVAPAVRPGRLGLGAERQPFRGGAPVVVQAFPPARPAGMAPPAPPARPLLANDLVALTAYDRALGGPPRRAERLTPARLAAWALADLAQTAADEAATAEAAVEPAAGLRAALGADPLTADPAPRADAPAEPAALRVRPERFEPALIMRAEAAPPAAPAPDAGAAAAPAAGAIPGPQGASPLADPAVLQMLAAMSPEQIEALALLFAATSDSSAGLAWVQGQADAAANRRAVRGVPPLFGGLDETGNRAAPEDIPFNTPVFLDGAPRPPGPRPLAPRPTSPGFGPDQPRQEVENLLLRGWRAQEDASGQVFIIRENDALTRIDVEPGLVLGPFGRVERVGRAAGDLWVELETGEQITGQTLPGLMPRPLPRPTLAVMRN